MRQKWIYAKFLFSFCFIFLNFLLTDLTIGKVSAIIPSSFWYSELKKRNNIKIQNSDQVTPGNGLEAQAGTTRPDAGRVEEEGPEDEEGTKLGNDMVDGT